MSVVIHHTENPTIHLTSAAKSHILNYLKDEADSLGVRFSVKKTGCSGYSYHVETVFTSLEQDLITALDEKYSIYIDKISYPFLKEMVVDYVKQGLNKKFVFSNPNQTGQCGCGESFTVE